MPYLKFFQSLFILLAIIGLAFCFLPESSPTAFAANTYTPETKLGIFRAGDIGELINNIYEDFLIPLSGFLALIAFAKGGFKYMTSAGNNALMSSAKEDMIAAIVGIAIILGAYILLKIINPELVNIDIVTE